jgi:hypothetical protein
MINSIANTKPVAAAKGRCSGWMGADRRDWPDASRRASAPAINPFMAATHEAGPEGENGPGRAGGESWL